MFRIRNTSNLTLAYAFFICAPLLGAPAAPGENHGTRIISLPAGPVESVPGLRVEYLEDPTGKFTLSHVLGPAKYGFRASTRRRLGFGQSGSAYWLRLSIRNDAKHRRTYFPQIEFPRLDRIEYYELRGADIAAVRRAGDVRPFEQRPRRHPDFVFPLEAAPGELVRIYIRAESDGITQIPLVVRDEKSYTTRNELRKTMLGAYYGILLVMAIYTMALFLAIRDTAYIYYSFCVISFALYQMTANGMAYEYLWPESPVWNNRAIPFFTSCACFGTALFSMRFLNTRRFVPGLTGAFRFTVWGSVLAAALSLSPYYVQASHLIRLLALLFIALVVFAAIRALRRGFRPAIFYLLGWSVYLIGVVLFVLQLRDWVPTNAVTEHGMQIGSALEAVLLALGLTDRVQTIRKEKDAARIQAARNRRLAMRRLVEANKVKDEFVQQLEIQVGERTSELNGALKSLRERDEIIRLELEIATEIQKSILPDPDRAPERLHWAVHYQAVGEVGGDFYDIIPLPGGGSAAVVADASGHGIPAALMTMIAKISFAEAVRGKASPADIMAYVRRNFLDSVRIPGYYVTAFIALIQPDGMVAYSNAGHLAPFILRKDESEAESLELPGIILGGIDMDLGPYNTGEIQLNPGDRLFMYTDGITEATDENDLEYGEERLRKMARATRLSTVEETKAIIMKDWFDYTSSSNRKDDVTLVVLEAAGDD